jgi:hypothetical protein
MGVDTKAILAASATVEKIKEALEKRYSNVEVHNTSFSHFFNIYFKDGLDERRLSISTDINPDEHGGIDGVWVNLSYWGNSVQIIEYLCSVFGGYIDRKDCDSIGYEPCYPELYAANSKPDPIGAFRNEVIAKLGYEKLPIAMELFDKYKSLK